MQGGPGIRQLAAGGGLIKGYQQGGDVEASERTRMEALDELVRNAGERGLPPDFSLAKLLKQSFIHPRFLPEDDPDREGYDKEMLRRMRVGPRRPGYDYNRPPEMRAPDEMGSGGLIRGYNGENGSLVGGQYTTDQPHGGGFFGYDATVTKDNPDYALILERLRQINKIKEMSGAPGMARELAPGIIDEQQELIALLGSNVSTQDLREAGIENMTAIPSLPVQRFTSWLTGDAADERQASEQARIDKVVSDPDLTGDQKALMVQASNVNRDLPQDINIPPSSIGGVRDLAGGGEGADKAAADKAAADKRVNRAARLMDQGRGQGLTDLQSLIMKSIQGDPEEELKQKKFNAWQALAMGGAAAMGSGDPSALGAIGKGAQAGLGSFATAQNVDIAQRGKSLDRAILLADVEASASNAPMTFQEFLDKIWIQMVKDDPMLVLGKTHDQKMDLAFETYSNSYGRLPGQRREGRRPHSVDQLNEIARGRAITAREATRG